MPRASCTRRPGEDAHARRGGRQGERGEDASFHGWGAEVVSAVSRNQRAADARRVSRPGDCENSDWRSKTRRCIFTRKNSQPQKSRHGSYLSRLREIARDSARQRDS